MFSQDMTRSAAAAAAAAAAPALPYTMSYIAGKEYMHMNRSHDFSAFQRLVKSLFPGAQIQNIRVIQGSTSPLHLLRMSNGLELILKTRPLSPTPIIRLERFLLETDAAVLAILWQSGVKGIGQPLKAEIPRFPSHNAYFLRHAVKGVSLAELETPLSSDEQKCVDRKLGDLVKSIGRHTSSQFGLVHPVTLGMGCHSWKQTFLALLDALMWDTENVFISLPYPEISSQAKRLSAALDDVTVPHLVVIDIGKPSHIIIDPETRQFSGVVDFSSALWGDPLMADIFESPSPAFLEGFDSDLLETKSAVIRLLLYSCFRSILKIARQYYRSRQDDEELTARRVLTSNLATLATLHYS